MPRQLVWLTGALMIWNALWIIFIMIDGVAEKLWIIVLANVGIGIMSFAYTDSSHHNSR